MAIRDISTGDVDTSCLFVDSRSVRTLWCLLPLVFTVLPPAANDVWIGVRTRNLRVVSNASERATREATERLEQFVAAVSQVVHPSTAPDVPVTVMIFKNDASFAPFRPHLHGRPQNVDGYFQRSDDENIIALNLSASEASDPMRVIFHEYTHLLTSRSSGRLPWWLQEGLAEFYSTVEPAQSRLTLGRPIGSHVTLLRTAPFIPLRTLFNVQRDSQLYNEGERQTMFYAESWAIVHYLMMADKSAHRPAFEQFIAALEIGTESETAFARAFQTTGEALETSVRTYIAGRTYPFVTRAIAATAAASTARTEPVSEAEAAFCLGNLLLRTRRGDEAEPYFARAHELDPALARADEGFAFLALDRGHTDDAIAHFKTAVDHGTQNHLALYYYATALWHQTTDASSGLATDDVRRVTQLLRASIDLMPSFAPAYQLLSAVDLTTGDDLREGERLARTAIALDPQRRETLVTLASIQLRMGAYAAAKETATRILDLPDASATLRAEARRIIDEANKQ
jgi:tetratricopeptide (TPR) repeat protein